MATKRFRSFIPGLIAIAVGLGISATVIAAVTPIEQNQVSRSTPELSSVALNAAAASRTFEIKVDGRHEVTVYIDYNRGGTGAATAILMTCLTGPTGDINYKLAKLTDGSSPEISDSAQHQWRWPVSASDNPRWVVTPLNDEWIKCVVSGEGSPTADDVIASVQTRLGVL
jgi:hypothetical protein